MERSARVHTLFADGVTHLADQGRVAQEQAMRPEDGRRFLAKLGADTFDNGVKLVDRGLASVLETADLVGEVGRIDLLRIARGEHRIDAVGPCDRNPRRYWYASQHDGHCSGRCGGGQSGR